MIDYIKVQLFHSINLFVIKLYTYVSFAAMRIGNQVVMFRESLRIFLVLGIDRRFGKFWRRFSENYSLEIANIFVCASTSFWLFFSNYSPAAYSFLHDFFYFPCFSLDKNKRKYLNVMYGLAYSIRINYRI